MSDLFGNHIVVFSHEAAHLSSPCLFLSISLLYSIIASIDVSWTATLLERTCHAARYTHCYNLCYVYYCFLTSGVRILNIINIPGSLFLITSYCQQSYSSLIF